MAQAFEGSNPFPCTETMEKHAHLHKLIEENYTKEVRKEWTRHERHDIEYKTTIYLLQRYLPKGGLILDAGGGPGRYTIELAKKGYKVILLDTTQANLDFAKKRIHREGVENNVLDIIKGRIEDLSMFENQKFDAVLCLGGPLSHVMDTKLRKKAVSELFRVAKNEAPILVSVISRIASICRVTIDPKFQDELAAPYFKVFVTKGDYYGGYGFTAFHGFLQEEFRRLLEKAGARKLKIFALEGFFYIRQNSTKKLEKNKKLWNIAWTTYLSLLERPDVIGVSDHFLAVFKK